MAMETMDYLTSNLQWVEISLEDGRKMMNNKELAWENLVKKWEKPELLVWADCFFDLKLQVARTLNNGSRLVSTQIGYIIGGQGLLQGVSMKAATWSSFI